MARILFVVAKTHPELLANLGPEFPGEDVRVLMDRRAGEQPAQVLPQHAAQRDPRRQVVVERELRSAGYSVVELPGGRGAGPAERPPGNPTAIREVAAYLGDRFRYYTPIPAWDLSRDGQLFVILSGAGRPAHRVLFAREFLDYWGTASPDRIARMLDDWKLPEQIEVAGSRLVIVAAYGIQVGGW